MLNMIHYEYNFLLSFIILVKQKLQMYIIMVLVIILCSILM